MYLKKICSSWLKTDTIIKQTVFVLPLNNGIEFKFQFFDLDFSIFYTTWLLNKVLCHRNMLNMSIRMKF